MLLYPQQLCMNPIYILFVLVVLTKLPLHLSYTALPLQFQFIPEAVTVLEGTSDVAIVCVQYVSSEFQQLEQDVVVTLQTQDGSAIGELISMCCCFHLNMPLRAHVLPYLAWHLW